MYVSVTYKHKFSLHVHIMENIPAFIAFKYFGYLQHICSTDILQVNIWFHAQDFIFYVL